MMMKAEIAMEMIRSRSHTPIPMLNRGAATETEPSGAKGGADTAISLAAAGGRGASAMPVPFYTEAVLYRSGQLDHRMCAIFGIVWHLGGQLSGSRALI